MQFYIRNQPISLEELFKNITTELPRANISKISTIKYATDKDGNAYKLKLSIETLAYTKSEAHNKLGAAKQEIQKIKRCEEEIKK